MARAGAVLGLLGSVGLGYGAVTSSAFRLTATQLPELRWTPKDALVASIQVGEGTNVFRVATGPIVERLLRLPAVASAHVRVALPDRLLVDVTERKPVLAWRVADRDFLVDASGRLFVVASPAAAADAGVPTIVDTRAASADALVVGGSLDAIDLDAATRLGSLVPKDVGSGASSLELSVSDENGFALRAAPQGWIAIFGIYTPTHRTPDLIPGQVRLLRSLLDGREATVARVILADATSGTYVPKPTDKAAP